MGSQVSDANKVVVSVFVAVLAGCVAGLFFVGGAILDMKDAITEVKVSLVEVQHDIADLQADVADVKQDIAGIQEGLVNFRAEVSERFDAVEGRLSRVEAAIETHHGSLSGPAN